MELADISVDRMKSLIVETLMLQQTPEELGADQPLFGPEGLGLDSVDALQLVVALDKRFGLKIPDPATAQTVLRNAQTITEAVRAHLASTGAKPSE